MLQLGALMTQLCSCGWSHCLCSPWCGQLEPQVTQRAGKALTPSSGQQPTLLACTCIHNWRLALSLSYQEGSGRCQQCNSVLEIVQQVCRPKPGFASQIGLHNMGTQCLWTWKLRQTQYHDTVHNLPDTPLASQDTGALLSACHHAMPQADHERR